MADVELELFRSELRNVGLDPKRIYTRHFAPLSREEEKKWREARRRARERARYLEFFFPFATGKYLEHEARRDVLSRVIGVGVV